MKLKTRLTTALLLNLILLSVYLLWPSPVGATVNNRTKATHYKKAAPKKIVRKRVARKKVVHRTQMSHQSAKKVAKKVTKKPHHRQSKARKKTPKPSRLQNIRLHSASFSDLPGWDEADSLKSYEAFRKSCDLIVKQNPNKSISTPLIRLKAKDWQGVCRLALSKKMKSKEEAKHFFETWFHPVTFYKQKQVTGTFTGYYLPTIKGSDHQTGQYKVPIYGRPKRYNLKNRTTRSQINGGAIEKRAPVLAWVENEFDRYTLELEGSGIVQFQNGKKVYLGYDGENGAPYTSIPGIVIKKGMINKHQASNQAVGKYLKTHPHAMKSVFKQNKSFVFFKVMSVKAAFGAQGIALTPGYSIAVDRNWVPYGTPVWVNTTHKEPDNESEKPLQRLMVAQDTGGAIRGTVRGDVFWGEGETSTYIANHMKNNGSYWLLLPKSKKIA